MRHESTSRRTFEGRAGPDILSGERHRAQPAGITLVELLVVMGIIALVASLATVAFVPMVRGRALSSAAYALKNSVWQARTYAAAHNVRAGLFLYTNPLRAEVRECLPSGASSSAPVAKPLYLPGGVRFYSSRPVDRLQRVSGVVQLQSSGMASSLTFMPSGSLDPSAPSLGAVNVQIGLMGPTGGVERMAVVVLFASGLPYVEEAQ